MIHTQTYWPYSDKAIAERERTKKQGERNAKLTLIADIMNIRQKAGMDNDGRLFDELFDMSIDQLHQQVVITEDLAYKS